MLFEAPGGFVVGVVSGNRSSSGMKLRLSLLLRLLILFCTLGCEGFLKKEIIKCIKFYLDYICYPYL